MVYYFSGSFTRPMADYLVKMPEFEPIDILVSQLDRSSIKSAIDYCKEGIAKTLFIDSGAFSVHTGKATVDLEEYIQYVNGIDEYVSAIAQVDTIPGKFGQPKSPEDYEESARKSWENYLYMRKKLKSPEKLIYVFHYGESFDHLKEVLEWRDENGVPLQYLGVSPANDTSQKTKDIYMGNVYKIISRSSNPNVKTHLFGMTALESLSRVPAYSADSVSHRLRSAYGKIYTEKWGVISVSKRARSSKVKSGMSFIDASDDYNLEELKNYLANLHLTIEDVQDSNAARAAADMWAVMQYMKHNPYRPRVQTSKLFDM